jgi:hypothetical protein
MLMPRVSFDGKNIQWLNAADSLRMHIARYPLPMITADVMDQDWYASITEKLMWNTIIKQERGGSQDHNLPFPLACSLCAPCISRLRLIRSSGRSGFPVPAQPFGRVVV